MYCISLTYYEYMECMMCYNEYNVLCAAQIKVAAGAAVEVSVYCERWWREVVADLIKYPCSLFWYRIRSVQFIKHVFMISGYKNMRSL